MRVGRRYCYQVDVFLNPRTRFASLRLHCLSNGAFGITVAGEFSLGVNDCALYLRGVGLAVSYTGDCLDWEDSTNWTQARKDDLRQLALASMDALQHWYFWTWKVSLSTASQYMRI